MALLLTLYFHIYLANIGKMFGSDIHKLGNSDHELCWSFYDHFLCDQIEGRIFFLNLKFTVLL